MISGTINPGESRGFSLVEVVLAIGIFAFALTLVFGLLPIGLKSSRSSLRETDSSRLLGRMEQDVRNWRKSASATPLYGMPIPTPASPDQKFFDLSLKQVTSTDPNRFYRVEQTIQQSTNGLNLYLRASWPALAPVTNAEGNSELVTFVFVR